MNSKGRPDELRRQAALYSLALLDTEPEEEFDRIARLAQRLLAVPSALVSFMDHDRQWYKARVGVDTTEAKRAETFCTHVIDDGSPLVVPDATLDPLAASGAREPRAFSGDRSAAARCAQGELEPDVFAGWGLLDPPGLR